MIRFAAASLSVLALSSASHAQDVIESEQADFIVETVAGGLEYPWSIAFLPDGAYLVTEREGRLRVIDENGLREAPVSGLPDDLLVERQGGLLDVALAPDFATSRTIYFSYAEGTAEANNTALARAQLSSDLTTLENVEDIFHVNFEKARGFHFGGRILFNPDGTLFLTLGDGGNYQDEAQNPENHLGAVVRLNLDGSIPNDNPEIENGAPGVYSFGHRNAQGISRNPATGSVWELEHGARGGDEINILAAGDNYGWPEITYGINYDGTIITEDRERDGLTQPIWYWNPSIAPSGMDFYTGDAFEHWQGDLFVSALAGSKVERLEIDGDRVISVEPLLADMGQRFRDVRTGPDGALYVLTDDFEGSVLRLVPAEAD
ncbi:MAG: glucose dehydrogenase [Oceanicaulis sp.]|uniref:PQQ-dependent sugar dehydrogenase n=1 Tax=Oceanicaulis sp. UBA2681 TaxID=1947007 RepID=UPI000C094FBD|nr:PQQ-dependent sugar dehydrogenase [Oceanicaulis sp. UBA2681]MAP48992.1 glucose dehydrogenase [Oceanicaulis sp.]HCR66270.1 glucose dehydrogenase [Oceanicaulis sp.]|tara:strand:- start:55 stop:1182 length:1128 start_codon:yes stop_codon:yes gene_type:complete